VTDANPTKISRDDIQAKLNEIDAEINETTEAAKPAGIAIAVGAVVVVLVVVFVLGRRKGRRKTTIVEVRRL
jgi:signal transduction histidine kinase